MSRYLILVLLNLPLVVIALAGALVDFKMGKISRKSFFRQTAIWLIILGSLIAAQPIYNFVSSNGFTQTESLSLFDVILATGVILVLFMANRSRIKLESLERRVQDLHQELSIRLSKDDGSSVKKYDRKT